MLFGAGQFFEQVGVLDGSGNFVIAAGPLAQVDAAATVRAEGEVFAAGKDDGAAGGAAEGFDFRGGGSWHSSLILIPSCDCRIVALPVNALVRCFTSNEKAKALHARDIEVLQIEFSPVDESLLGSWPPVGERLGSGR